MNWWDKSTPDNFEPRPWLHPAAAAYLETLLSKKVVVFEQGCGGSTLWLAKRCKHVTSIDQPGAWFDAVMAKLPKNVYLSVENSHSYQGRFDLLLIDGLGANRPAVMRAAHEMTTPGAIVVVDNAEREAYASARYELRKQAVCFLTITGYAVGLNMKRVETEFYRMPGGETWI